MFDKKEFYQSDIEPIIKKLTIMCYDHHLPMFVAVAIKDDGENTEYANDMVSAYTASATLSDNRIAKFVNVVNGYSVVAPLNNDESLLEDDIGKQFFLNSDTIITEDITDNTDTDIQL